MKYDPEYQADLGMRKTITRVKRHLNSNHPNRRQVAARCMAQGARTAQSWLDGTHPKLQD